MNIQKAREFIYKNARPLDLVRWQYLFEDGSQESVLRILRIYQNEDGGFGHGLELDCWNPHSSPIQTWAATKIIKEIQLKDANHPLVQGILHYLETTVAFNGHMWLNTIPTNNDYPHAPWWNDDPQQELSYNSTASFIGFIIRYAKPDSPLYQRACQLLQEAYAYFKENGPLESMHTVSCFVELFEYLQECHFYENIDFIEFEQLLRKQIKMIVNQDITIWSTDYVCKPSLLIESPKSVFYNDHRELCDLECQWLSNTQEIDGSWKITWSWNDYPEQWHIAKNWWKADVIIKNVKFYQLMKL